MHRLASRQVSQHTFCFYTRNAFFAIQFVSFPSAKKLAKARGRHEFYSSYSPDFASMYVGVFVRSPSRGRCCLACLFQLLLNLTFAFNIFNFVLCMRTFCVPGFRMFMLRAGLFHLTQVQMLRNGIQCGIALRMFPSDQRRKKTRKKARKDCKSGRKTSQNSVCETNFVEMWKFFSASTLTFTRFKVPSAQIEYSAQLVIWILLYFIRTCKRRILCGKSDTRVNVNGNCVQRMQRSRTGRMWTGDKAKWSKKMMEKVDRLRERGEGGQTQTGGRVKRR